VCRSETAEIGAAGHGDIPEPGTPNGSPLNEKVKLPSIFTTCQNLTRSASGNTPDDEFSAGENQMVKAVPRSSETNIDLG
jgi:hypothetical protein